MPLPLDLVFAVTRAAPGEPEETGRVSHPCLLHLECALLDFDAWMRTAGIAYALTGGVASSIRERPCVVREIEAIIDAVRPADLPMPPAGVFRPAGRPEDPGPWPFVHEASVIPLSLWPVRRRQRPAIRDAEAWGLNGRTIRVPQREHLALAGCFSLETDS